MPCESKWQWRPRHGEVPLPCLSVITMQHCPNGHTSTLSSERECMYKVIKNEDLYG